MSSGLPNKTIKRVVASRHELQTGYAALSGKGEDEFGAYVYMSNYFGETWQSIVGNLPWESVNVIAEDPRDKDVLYTGTDLGVYATLDRGQTWHSLCNGLPTINVFDLIVHPRDYDLVIGTHGSIFVLDVENIQSFS